MRAAPASPAAPPGSLRGTPLALTGPGGRFEPAAGIRARGRVRRGDRAGARGALALRAPCSRSSPERLRPGARLARAAARRDLPPARNHLRGVRRRERSRSGPGRWTWCRASCPRPSGREVERGLAQRIKALNLFLEDLYVGERAALRDGIVPAWLVYSSEGFLREAVGLPAPHGARCVVAGIDLVRDADGVVPRARGQPAHAERDLVRAAEPRGADARAAAPVCAPPHPPRAPLRLVAPERAALARAARRAPTAPRVVVLTPGIWNSAYFEHAFLAQQMGAELCRGPRPRRRGPGRVHAHDARAGARGRDLPARRRRVRRPGALPPGLGAGRARA